LVIVDGAENQDWQTVACASRSAPPAVAAWPQRLFESWKKTFNAQKVNESRPRAARARDGVGNGQEDRIVATALVFFAVRAWALASSASKVDIDRCTRPSALARSMRARD
jgi:hypothetical protein